MASLEHEQWSHWASYLIKSGYITDETKVAQWSRQINTPYEDLCEAEKELDRKWADKVLKVLDAVAAKRP